MIFHFCHNVFISIQNIGRNIPLSLQESLHNINSHEWYMIIMVRAQKCLVLHFFLAIAVYSFKRHLDTRFYWRRIKVHRRVRKIVNCNNCYKSLNYNNYYKSEWNKSPVVLHHIKLCDQPVPDKENDIGNEK